MSDTEVLSPLDVLRRVFGYPEFRGRQAEVIERTMAGGDALGIKGSDSIKVRALLGL